MSLRPRRKRTIAGLAAPASTSRSGSAKSATTFSRPRGKTTSSGCLACAYPAGGARVKMFVARLTSPPFSRSPETFDLPDGVVEKAYKTLQKFVHPDKFGNRTEVRGREGRCWWVDPRAPPGLAPLPPWLFFLRSCVQVCLFCGDARPLRGRCCSLRHDGNIRAPDNPA